MCEKVEMKNRALLVPEDISLKCVLINKEAEMPRREFHIPVFVTRSEYKLEEKYSGETSTIRVF